MRLHRQPEHLARLTQDAERFKVTVASILHGAAVDRLHPELANDVIAGRKQIADVIPAVLATFDALVWKAAKQAREDHS